MQIIGITQLITNSSNTKNLCNQRVLRVGFSLEESDPFVVVVVVRFSDIFDDGVVEVW